MDQSASAESRESQQPPQDDDGDGSAEGGGSRILDGSNRSQEAEIDTAPQLSINNTVCGVDSRLSKTNVEDFPSPSSLPFQLEPTPAGPPEVQDQQILAIQSSPILHVNAQLQHQQQ